MAEQERKQKRSETPPAGEAGQSTAKASELRVAKGSELLKLLLQK